MREDLKWDSYWGKADLSAIESFEKKINRTFPSTYKKIASQFNGAFLKEKNVFDFFSSLVGEKVSRTIGLFQGYGNLDTTETMEYSWEHKPEDFPDMLVTFSRLGNGDHLCFDYRKNPKTNNPLIVLWHHEGTPGTDEELSPVANSFDEFLDMLYDAEAENPEQ